MPYYRRPYKRARYGSRDKYSVQQRAFQFTAAAGSTSYQVIVPGTTLEGMRKVKHITVNLTAGSDVNMYWALVYVPQATTPGAIQVSTTATAPGMYEPNQFVMNCGVVNGSAGPIRFSSPLARNLNDGDAIYLLIRPVATIELSIAGTCRYAITLQ